MRLIIIGLCSITLMAQTKVDYPTQIKNGPLFSDAGPAGSTLQTLCATVGTGTLAITKHWNALTNQTIGCNISFAGGVIQPASGNTVTISGAITAAPIQIFDTSLGGTISYTGPTTLFYPQWTGAKCDGSTDDHLNFTSILAIATSGSTVAVTSNCVLSAGVIINKPVKLSAGAPGTTSQLLAGTNGITMITVAAGTANVGIDGVSFSANSHTGVTGLLLNGTGGSPVSRFVANRVYFNGLFDYDISCLNSYFNTISNSTFRLAKTGISLNTCNSTTLLNDNFFMDVTSPSPTTASAVLAHNMINVNVIGGTVECGGELTFYNIQAPVVTGVYFESQTSSGCPSMTGAGYITLGGAFGATPMAGAVISGNTFNGAADYGVICGDSTGAEISGNNFTTNVLAVAQDLTNQSTNTFTNTCHVGINSYNINSAGDVESTHFGFINGSPGNYPASNATVIQDQALLFPYSQVIPQHAHVPLGNGACYWTTVDGTNTTAGSLHCLWNNNGVFATTFPITDAEISSTGATDFNVSNGAIRFQPTGSTRATPVAGYGIADFTDGIGARHGYIVQDDTAGTNCGVAHAFCVNASSSQPLVLNGPGNASKVMCWKADGKSIGYATVAEITAGTCH